MFVKQEIRSYIKKKKIREKKKNKLLALKNYILVYIVVFDNSILFKQNSKFVVIYNIKSINYIII